MSRSPLIAAFLRKIDREGRWNGEPKRLADWYEGPTEFRQIDQRTLGRFLSTAYAEGRAFERRKADREAAKTAAFFDHIQTHADRDRDRIIDERDALAAEVLRARPLIEKATSFALLIADVQWLLHGVRLVLPPKRLRRIALPDENELASLRTHLDRLTPQPPKDLPF